MRINLCFINAIRAASVLDIIPAAKYMEQYICMHKENRYARITFYLSVKKKTLYRTFPKRDTHKIDIHVANI